MFTPKKLKQTKKPLIPTLKIQIFLHNEQQQQNKTVTTKNTTAKYKITNKSQIKIQPKSTRIHKHKITKKNTNKDTTKVN